MIEVRGHGPRRARIVVVGEAPGAHEEAEGRPFVGPAGKLLRKHFMMVGIDPDDVYFTNICFIRPPENHIRSFFDDAGRPNTFVINGVMQLMEDLYEIQPNVVVAFGNYPLWALTGKAEWRRVKRRDGSTELTYTGIARWRGSILESVIGEHKVVPTYHPAYILREGMSDHGTWICDLERVAREAAFKEIRRPRKEIVIDPKGLTRRCELDWLLSDMSKTLTFDIEGSGHRLHCVGMTTDRDRAIVIPTKSTEDVDFVRRVLTSGLRLNGQNLIYDASLLEWYRFIHCIDYIGHDTMLAAHAANIELPKGLDYLVSIYTDQPAYKHMVDWKKIETGQQPMSVLYHYNAIDTWVTHEIMEEQWKHDLTDPMVLRTFQFEMALIKPLWDMSRRGVRVDMTKLASLRDELEQDIHDLGLMLNLLCGREINVKSVVDKRWLLFDFLDLKPLKMNKTGAAVDDKTIAALQIKCNQSDFAYKVMTALRSITVKRDLISKFVDMQFDTDGRMRGHYDPSATTTGRLGSRKFYPTGTGGNQQNIHKDRTVRRLFIPDKGRIFVYADLERAESLVVAHLTNDPVMLDDHAPGVDGHIRLATELFSIPIHEVTKERRYVCKQTRHAGNYMEGPVTMARNVNREATKTGVALTETQCKSLLQAYRRRHIMLQPWWDDINRQLWHGRKLTTLLGRQRIFYDHIESILPKAVAFVPQSTVGDALNIGLLNLHGVICDYMESERDRILTTYNELREAGVECLMQIHDAVALQILAHTDLDYVLPRIRELMTVPLMSPTGTIFTIPVEIAVGSSWGDVEVWKGAETG